MQTLTIKDCFLNIKRCKRQMKATHVGDFLNAKEKVQLSILYREQIEVFSNKIAKIEQINKTKMLAIKDIDVHFAMIYEQKNDAFFLDKFLHTSSK